MFIETERFGSFELDDTKVIDFPQGLPGLEELHQYVIVKVEETEPIYWLQSAEEKYIALPVIVPFEIMEDYTLQIRDKELSELKVEDQNDLLIMNVVVIPEQIEKMTANLAAPIIVNAKAGLGKQIIVDAKELPVRYPIYESVMYALKGGAADAGSVSENG
ncbi:flagellar assembly protein FliW [Eubacteriales bacterium OttesenSCG-928-N14]|nr:flagellar assembly protein FliW [Eubacteriales bacterium OttesenSCG-928-N14]